jgi:hypothetical protein
MAPSFGLLYRRCKVIILKDSFNNLEISRHRSVAAAVKAREAHSKMIARANGKGSFIRYGIKSDDGADISEEIFAAEEAFAFGRGRK